MQLPSAIAKFGGQSDVTVASGVASSGEEVTAASRGGEARGGDGSLARELQAAAVAIPAINAVRRTIGGL